jgi:hypothetical protein
MLLDLNEGSLDETVGVAGVATDTDIVTFFADSSIFHAPSFGAIDWNGNGEATEPNVQVDLDNDSGTPNTMLLTANDWEVANGALKYLNFKFQCTSAFAKGSGAPATGDLVESSVTTPEPGHRYAREHHVLYPPAAASVLFEPACSNPGLKPRAAGTVQLALLGSAAFDANQVDLNSLSLHGAHPASITVSDVNNDGIPDLLLEFQGSEVHVSPRATHVRLTGWLKNSRSFVGEARPTITNDMNTQPASCH